MRLSDAKYTLEIDQEEVNVLAYALKNNLESQIERHWNNLQQHEDGELLFNKYCERDLRIMKELFSIMGEPDQYEGYIRSFKSAFQKKREERAAKQ